jgi:hypothetical protein
VTTAVAECTATGAFTEIDARDAVRAITTTEGVPAPQSVLMHTERPNVVYVRLASRDEVDEWAAMLGIDTYRAAFAYSTRWDEAGVHGLFPGVLFEAYCDLPAISWRPRQSAQVSA